jgi:type IV conjugative transfer system protein TraL
VIALARKINRHISSPMSFMGLVPEDFLIVAMTWFVGFFAQRFFGKFLFVVSLFVSFFVALALSRFKRDKPRGIVTHWFYYMGWRPHKHVLTAPKVNNRFSVR